MATVFAKIKIYVLFVRAVRSPDFVAMQITLDQRLLNPGFISTLVHIGTSAVGYNLVLWWRRTEGCCRIFLVIWEVRSRSTLY